MVVYVEIVVYTIQAPSLTLKLISETDGMCLPKNQNKF